MNVSVIIPTLNEEGYIFRALTALQDQTVMPLEIIVVDGGSTDLTKKIVKGFKNVIFVQGPKHQGKQRNLAAKIARGDILLFLDADTMLPSTFIEKSVREIKERNLDIAIPWYSPYPNINKVPFTLISLFTNTGIKIMQHANPFGGACSILIRKKLFNQTKGFDENCKIDDTRLIREAARKGNYGVISENVFVSERRFEKYGYVRTTINYAILTVLLVFNQYELAERVDYKFGEFN